VHTLFGQSDAALWCSIRFGTGWSKMSKIEDAANRIYRTLYPNFEIYVQAQMSQNAIHIKKAQKTAMTSPFCIDSNGSRDLQFVIGHGSAEVTHFENIVTDNGRKCIFQVLYADLCERFMTVENLGALATEEVTFTYLDEDNQIRFWSASLLDLFDYDKCVEAPFQLRQFHDGRGPGEKCDSWVCSLLPVEEGWHNMSFAGSQLLQRVYKRLHSTFTIGLSRSSSISSKDPDNAYESPLPLNNEVFGGGHGCIDSNRRTSDVGQSIVSGKREKSSP
jgi:hypothetical protein